MPSATRDCRALHDVEELTRLTGSNPPMESTPGRRASRWLLGTSMAGMGFAAVAWFSAGLQRSGFGPATLHADSAETWDAVSKELMQLSNEEYMPGLGAQHAGHVLHGLKPGQKCKAPKPTTLCQTSGKQCQHSIYADRKDCSIVAINLDIKVEDIVDMNKVARAKLKKPCNVIVNYKQDNEMRFSGATIKYKGATGSFMGCYNKMSGQATPRWKACRKLSVRVDLRKARQVGPSSRPASEVLGLTQLQLMGMMHDDSLVRNHIGYKIQQNIGLLSPCSIAVDVYINGDYDGVSDLTEGIDDTYIANRFPGEDGTLWVEMWPASVSPTWYKNLKPIDAFAGQMMVHEGPDGPGYDLFASFFRDAKACFDSGKLCTKARATKILEKYTYPDSFIDAFVGAALSSNSDTPLILKHNFYLFILRGKIYYLLWDFNQVLYDVTGSPIPGYAMAKPWYYIPNEEERKKLCPYDVPSSSGDLSQRRFHHFTCDPLGHIMGLSWKDTFLERMRNLDHDELTKKVDDEIRTWNKRIESSVTCDAANGGWPPSVEEMNEETEPIIEMYSDVTKFWKQVSHGERVSWPHPTFADFSREVNECFFDGLQSAQYLGQVGLMITAGVRDCPHGAPARAQCANDISNVIASFSFFGSFLSGMLLHCPIREVTGLAHRGIGRLYYEGPKVECAEMSTRLAAGLASVSAGASGLSEMCLPGVARANRGLNRRLVSTGFMKDRPTEVATCTFDTLGAVLWLAEGAIHIDKATKTCSQFYHDRTACSRDVSTIIEAFSYLGMFTANSVAQCAREANFPIDKAFRATCAADISQFIGALATIAEGGSGIAHSCGRVGPFRRVVVSHGHRHLTGEQTLEELENSRAAWEDVATKGDHMKLEAWLNKFRSNATMLESDWDDSPISAFG